MKKEELTDWALTYFRNKDLIHKRIELIEKDKEGFDIYIKFKDKEHFVIVEPMIENFESLIAKISPEKFITLVTLNSLPNLNFIVEKWKQLADLPRFSIIFANPNSAKDTKWLISPHNHAKIADEKSLKLGLKSMFEMVDPVH